MKALLAAICTILATGLAAPAGAAVRDVCVLVVGHWEPLDGTASTGDVYWWTEKYREFADRHRDSEGRPLQHSFFVVNREDEYAIGSTECLPELSRLVYDGYGEIEMHVHHDETGRPGENAYVFQEGMRDLLAQGQEHGLWVTAEHRPRTAFGFIHGMWALDNSRYLGGRRGECRVTVRNAPHACRVLVVR